MEAHKIKCLHHHPYHTMRSCTGPQSSSAGHERSSVHMLGAARYVYCYSRRVDEARCLKKRARRGGVKSAGG